MTETELPACVKKNLWDLLLDPLRWNLPRGREAKQGNDPSVPL